MSIINEQDRAHILDTDCRRIIHILLKLEGKIEELDRRLAALEAK